MSRQIGKGEVFWLNGRSHSRSIHGRAVLRPFDLENADVLNSAAAISSLLEKDQPVLNDMTKGEKPDET